MNISKNFDAQFISTSGPLDTPCLIWQRGKTTAGYGMFSGDNGLTYTHREAWERLFGRIPNGKQVLHHCDTPACGNTDHLYLGGHKENADDREARDQGNHAFGERCGNVVLNPIYVDRIRDLSRHGVSQRQIAKWLNKTRGCVRAVIDGRTWCNI